MKNRLLKYITFVLAIAAGTGCVEDFKVHVDKESSTVLVVDALFTTEEAEQHVKLTTSLPYSALRDSLPPVSGAFVTISDGERTIRLDEDGNSGYYMIPADFHGEEGRSYTLDVSASLDGRDVQCSATETMPLKGIRADAMDYYKMQDSLWVFALWGQDEPGIISHYGAEMVVHDKRKSYSNWVFIDGSDMFDGNYLYGGEYLFYSCSKLLKTEDGEELLPLEEGDVVTLRFYTMADFFYNWFMSMSSETTAHFPMISPQPANLATNFAGDDVTGVFGLANLTTLTVTIGDPERTREQMFMDHLDLLPYLKK